MGRNVWQHQYPEAILSGVEAILHQGMKVKEAVELVESLKSDKTRRHELFAVTKEDIETSKLH